MLMADAGFGAGEVDVFLAESWPIKDAQHHR